MIRRRKRLLQQKLASVSKVGIIVNSNNYVETLMLTSEKIYKVSCWQKKLCKIGGCVCYMIRYFTWYITYRP
jgi:hypothetical protein